MRSSSSRINVSCRNARWIGNNYVCDFDYLIECVKDAVSVLKLFGYYDIRTTLDNNMTFHIDINCPRPLLMNHYNAIENRYDTNISWYYANRDDFEDWELGIEPDDPNEGLEKD